MNRERQGGSKDMVRITLFSEDRTLFSLLSSALGGDFPIAQELEEGTVSARIRAGDCDVVIVDLHSGRLSIDGRIAAAQRLIGLPVPVLILADDSLRLTAFEMVQNGAFAFCRRPPSIRDLKTMLSRAVEASAIRRPFEPDQWRMELPDHCDRIIGSSPRMQRVYQHIRSVANINAAVLVTGESGTGKELIARAVHNLGSRKDKPFVAVSCGAIPETLIEAELFGHEKGAFTGSNGAREGYFEQAADGTLFLDEIGDLSLFTQVKLLRVLQQMEFCRLGSTRVTPLRARVIFATHQDLGKLVAEGKFRQDLYYRINVMQIESPGLRDRVEDIPWIADHFLRHYAALFDKDVCGIDPDAMETMLNYPWPGNVRELENVMQRAIIQTSGPTVRAEDLSIHLAHDADDAIADEIDIVDFSDYNPTGTFERKIRDYKVRLAVNAVREASGNKSLAARSLSISRAYLHRLLRLAGSEVLYEEPLREVAAR